MINKNIIGYGLVKNVTKAEGYEHCGQGLLFVVRRDSKNYLDGLCEVRENKRGTCREIEEKYPFNDGYIVWFGEVVCDEIRFYWS